MLIKEREDVGIMHNNSSKAFFIEYSNSMDDVYENMEEYDPNKYRKIYIMLFH